MPTNMYLLQEDADKPSAADEGYPKIRNKEGISWEQHTAPNHHISQRGAPTSYFTAAYISND